MESSEKSVESYIVRVMCGDRFEFVAFSEDELTITKFPEKVANHFGIKFDAMNSGLVVTDNLGCPIPKSMFGDVVKDFRKGSNFFIRIEYQISSSLQGNISIVTVPMLETFFRRQQNAELLLKGKTKTLDDELRKKIVNCLVDFMVEAFGKGDVTKVTKQHKLLTARTAICLFEGLKSNDSNNELSKLVGNQGFFSGRIKYLKRMATVLSNDTESSAQNIDNIEAQLAQVQISPENDLQFLKTCVVKNVDRNVILAKLKSTQKLRESLMRDENIDLRTSFPFFFAEPRLIVIDFNNNPKYGCDVNAFLQNWSRYGPNLRTNVNRNIVTDWEQSIENLLLLLQVFPSKSCHLPFNEAIKKLIVFRVVGTPIDKMIEDNNTHPYIVAYGTSKKDIISFYIEAEKHIISLPSNLTIVETFDIFFKLHFVLGLTFDKALENMIVFIQRLIYNLRKGKCSSAYMQSYLEKLL